MRPLLLALTVSLLFAGCRENKYPGTARQSANIYLQGRGKMIATAIVYFRDTHGRWPSTLSDLVREDILSSQDLLYPKLYELPDRRDILGLTDGLEWIYLLPSDQGGNFPLLMAPLPYTSTLGNRLRKPRRIVVKRDTIPETIEESEAAKILQKLTQPGVP